VTNDSRHAMQPSAASFGPIGTAGSLGLTRVLASELHAVSATDPVTFVVAPAVLVAVAVLACYVPAQRATSVEPLSALQTE
jgi:putative ABC transport system permease protein